MTWPSKALVNLESSFKDFFSVRHVFLVSSGSAALTVILHALAQINNRQEVIIPSYTCFSVPASIAKAGLRVIVCDIEKASLNYDRTQLAALMGKRTLCVIASHLFGIPLDMEGLSALAQERGAFIVEDCAQAMGAQLRSKKVGALGDIAFFSLGRGKNICAVSGGIIITDDDRLARLVSRTISKLPAPRIRGIVSALSIAVFLSIFSRPSLYWLPANLPFLGIGKTVYSTKFRIERLPALSAGLAKDWRMKLDRFTVSRRVLAELYRKELAPYGFIFLSEPDGASAVYPRFPVIAGCVDERDRICNQLAQTGLGGSSNYPSAVTEIPQLLLSEDEKRRRPNGSAMAKELFTLPTHPDVSQSDVQDILRIVKYEAPPTARRLIALNN